MAEPLELEQDETTVETAEEASTREGIYGEIKRLLIARGIPANEIAFIHDFPTPARKAQAFAEVNAGRIRVMIASTEKAGTGVNMQERLYALHHLDTPWRPSDVEQREGRILRQGNIHKEVHLCQYITEGSFDGYMWVRHEVVAWIVWRWFSINDQTCCAVSSSLPKRASLVTVRCEAFGTMYR
nr:helicase C-terminal domain-containing protein [Nitrosomonas nitrosa]